MRERIDLDRVCATLNVETTKPQWFFKTNFDLEIIWTPMTDGNQPSGLTSALHLTAWRSQLALWLRELLPSRWTGTRPDIRQSHDPSRPYVRLVIAFHASQRKRKMGEGGTEWGQKKGDWWRPMWVALGEGTSLTTVAQLMRRLWGGCSWWEPGDGGKAKKVMIIGLGLRGIHFASFIGCRRFSQAWIASSFCYP